MSGEVQPMVDQLAKTSTDQSNDRYAAVVGQRTLGTRIGHGYDKERLTAYEKARAVEERLQNIENRLRDKVAEFNHSVGSDHSPIRFVFPC